MAKKSNKTEHVLNLITRSNENEAAEIIPAELDNAEPEETDEPEPAVPHQEHRESTDDKQVFLINLNEKLASEMILDVMEKMKVCTCDTCVNDVMALALNTLPPEYITTDAGKQYVQLDVYKKQKETDVLAALTKACVRVKASPRHEK